ncbi:MAG: hypothetical protein J6X72_00175, partial [Clostridia bacterium]|nr:hypothetical protein [Clostridia bacterium]
IFFEKTYVTAAEEVERGFLSVWYEGKQIFLSVEVFGLRENERYTINAKDENGNVVFAKDGVELQKDYSFTLDAPRNLFFTLSINADIVAVGELWMESEPEWEYDFASGEWTWEDGFSAASVSFAALDGGDPLILDALVEEQIVSDPDCTTDGVILYTARALWGELEFYDERTLTIPASGHAFGEPEFDWTTDSDGYYIAATATYTCTRDGCGHTETVPADIWTEEVAATCEADGYTVFIATAEWNDLTGSDNRSIPGVSAFGHEYPEPDPELEVEGVAFDFTQNANGEIVSATMTLTCTRCGQTLTYDADEIELMPTMEYDLCNEGGRAEYYVFWGSDGYEISRYMMVEIGPLGHNYDKPSFAWTTDQDGFYNGATLIAYCPNNGGHEETVTAEVEQTAVDPTCDADGYILYTATAEWNGETYVDEQLIPLTAPGHDYATPTFAWDPADENGNFNSATATFTCIRDGCGHTETVAATISATPHEPGCVETGYTVFTATAELGGVSGSDSVRKTGEEALGHAYPDPTEITPADNAFSYTYGEHGEIVGATMTLNCTRCGEPHTFEARSVEAVSSTGNLCEDGGDVTYRITWTGAAAYEKNVTVTITPTGHDYGEPTFEWDLNQDGWYDGATAVFVCSHDPTHTVEIEAELEPTAETSATCDVPATTTYTATAEWNGGTYTDERVVVWEFSTLGHQFGNLNENEPDESAFSYSYNDNGEIVDATMTLTCTRCGEPVTMHASRIALLSSEDDLCEEGGNAEYSILWSDGFELEYTRYEFATVGPLGHEYGSPYFDWDEGGDN